MKAVITFRKRLIKKNFNSCIHTFIDFFNKNEDFLIPCTAALNLVDSGDLQIASVSTLCNNKYS